MSSNEQKRLYARLQSADAAARRGLESSVYHGVSYTRPFTVCMDGSQLLCVTLITEKLCAHQFYFQVFSDPRNFVARGQILKRKTDFKSEISLEVASVFEECVRLALWLWSYTGKASTLDLTTAWQWVFLNVSFWVTA